MGNYDYRRRWWEIHDLYIHKKYSWQKDVRLYSYVEVWIIIIHDYVNFNIFQAIQKMEKNNENIICNALELIKVID